MIANSTNVKKGTFVNQCNNLINLAKANAAVKFRVLGYKREPKYLDEFNNKNKRAIQTATERLIKRLVDAMNTLKREERIPGFFCTHCIVEFTHAYWRSVDAATADYTTTIADIHDKYTQSCALQLVHSEMRRRHWRAHVGCPKEVIDGQKVVLDY